MDKMPRFLRSIRSIKRSSEAAQFPEVVFAVQWTKHLVDVLTKHIDDKKFVSDVIASSAEYFNTKMTEQQKSDAFFTLLGITAAKGRRRI